MAILTSDAAINAVSTFETEDLQRARGSVVGLKAISATSANYSGRNRGNQGKAAIGIVTNSAFPIRKRGGLSLSFALSNSSVSNSASIPPRTPPSGKLTINNSPLHMARLSWGDRHDILFAVTGGKLAGLSVNLQLFRLNGAPVFDKKTSLAPGGVVPSGDIILQPDGEETASGWIVFMPADSLRIASGKPIKPIELKYVATIKNNQSRQYMIEEGRIFLI